MSENASIETSEKELRAFSREPTQEYFGATPRSLRELGNSQDKKPSEIIKPVLKLSGLLSKEDKVEDIGPGAISKGMTIIVAREITNEKGKKGTEFKRGRVIDMEDDPNQDKIFRLIQPSLVPESRRHVVLIAEENKEVFKLNELREDFQKSKVILFKIP